MAGDGVGVVASASAEAEAEAAAADAAAEGGSCGRFAAPAGNSIIVFLPAAIAVRSSTGPSCCWWWWWWGNVFLRT